MQWWITFRTPEGGVRNAPLRLNYFLICSSRDNGGNQGSEYNGSRALLASGLRENTTGVFGICRSLGSNEINGPINGEDPLFGLVWREGRSWVDGMRKGTSWNGIKHVFNVGSWYTSDQRFLILLVVDPPGNFGVCHRPRKSYYLVWKLVPQPSNIFEFWQVKRCEFLYINNLFYIYDIK